MSIAVTFYGKTYWDAEIAVPLESLSQGKGKVDVPIEMAIGGFPSNAARAIGGMLSPNRICVVTGVAQTDESRVRDALPPGTVLGPLSGYTEILPAISVILNPATDCRILRDPGPAVEPGWRVDAVPDEAWSADLHVFGRLPLAFASEAMQRVRADGKRVAWCGGDALPPELEAQCDILCVNTAEGASLVGDEASSTRASAEALARRAAADGAVRLVTGRGANATIAAMRTDGEVRVFESEPAKIAREDIVGLLGVGDAFAATFLVTACFGPDGSSHDVIDVESGLARAQDAATHFITHPRPRGGRHA